MRVVKLSRKVFADDAEVDAFFQVELPRRTPPGLFFCKNEIAADGLEEGETILFTYRGLLRYVGRAASGRRANTTGTQPDYPNCFEVDVGSLRRGAASRSEIEQPFQTAGVAVSLDGQGWTRLPDGATAEALVEEFVRRVNEA